MIKIVNFDTTVTEQCATAKMVVEYDDFGDKVENTFVGWSKVHPKDNPDPVVGEAIAVGRMFHQAAMYFMYTLGSISYPDVYSPIDVGVNDIPSMQEIDPRKLDKIITELFG